MRPGRILNCCCFREALGLSFVGDAGIPEKIRFEVRVLKAIELDAKRIGKKRFTLSEKQFLEAEST